MAALPDPSRVLIDGVGGGALADSLVSGLAQLGRAPLRVRGADFQRPAGERFAFGRDDAEGFRQTWLDVGALRREVLTGDSWLPALWDAARDRSFRAARQVLPTRAVLLVDGLFLLGRELPADLSVHIALSPAALTRRGVPDWQLPAFAAYAETGPELRCDVLVRAEDPARPAVLYRLSPRSPSP